MTFSVRADDKSVIFALAAAHNQRTLDAISTSFHLTQYETISGDFSAPVITRPTAPTVDTVDTVNWALISTLVPMISGHFGDAVAHDTVASTASTYTAGDATDTATALLVLNDLKAVLNVHFTQAGAHYTDDNTNTVTNSDATDDTTLQVLLTELVTNVYAHWASAPAGTIVNVVGA